LPHVTIGALSTAGGVILLVPAVWMVLGQGSGGHLTTGKDPMQLAQFPLAVPYSAQPGRHRRPDDDLRPAKSPAVPAVAVAISALLLLIDLAVFRWANQVSARLDETAGWSPEGLQLPHRCISPCSWSPAAWPGRGHCPIKH
jgi:small neutral amino acid transporter SnatA (MarC family)